MQLKNMHAHNERIHIIHIIFFYSISLLFMCEFPHCRVQIHFFFQRTRIKMINFHKNASDGIRIFMQ